MSEVKRNLLKDIGIQTPVREIDSNTWGHISMKIDLSEGFIREFQDHVYWNYISSYQKLSEEFIREFEDKIDWDRIPASQILSDEFILEFNGRIDWELYFYYAAGSYPIMKKFISKTSYRSSLEFKSRHLNENQKREINKILELKNIF